MRIAGVVRSSLSNGIGLSFVIYTQGCLHKCKGCHNKNTWDLKGGVELNPDFLFSEIEKYSEYLDSVTFSGGEPLLQFREVFPLANRIQKELRLKTCLYTGYDFSPYEKEFEFFTDKETLGFVHIPFDMIVDGKFDIDKLAEPKQMKGSTNQNIWILEWGYWKREN